MYSNYIKSGILILLAGWLVASCTAVPNPEDDSFEGIIISASLDDEVTRTLLAETGEGAERRYEVRWKTGDKISVNGILSNAVASADNNKKSVDFTVSGSISAPYKVLYPGTSSTDVITLPATQNYVANSFDGAAAASYGTATKNGDKYTVRLDHFCGVLRFALNGSATLSKIEINSLGSEKLYGNFTLATDGNDCFTGSWSGGTAGTLTYNCSVTLSNTDTYFYVAIPAQAYASGLEALVYQSDGAFMRLKFQVGTTENPKTLGANDIVEFESKTFAAGRTENLFSINGLAAENGGEPSPAFRGITVATYNVLVQASRTKVYTNLSYQVVRDALGESIAKTDADIIGFNELDDANFEAGGTYPLKTIAEGQGFTGYTWDLSNPDDIKQDEVLGFPIDSYTTSNKFADGFAYKTALFDIDDSDYVWLSHTADNTYYLDRKSAFKKSGSPETTCVYAKFTHKASGKQFYFFVTHTPTVDHTGSEVGATPGADGKYDGEDADIAERRMRVLNNLIYFAAQKAGNLPYIIVGDFNFGPYIDTKKTKVQPLYTAMTSGGFTNAYDEVNDANNLSPIYTKYPGTQTGCLWGYDYCMDAAKYPQFRIDHIFLHDGSTQGITAQSYKTIRKTYDLTYEKEVEEDGQTTTVQVSGTWCPSDHFPVVSYITFD